MEKLKKIIKSRFLILDGAMGTKIQELEIPKEVWEEAEGCNELLNKTHSEAILNIHKEFINSGADIVKTNSFGVMDWVLEDYGLEDSSYELAKLSAKIAKRAFSELDKTPLVAGSLGPGTKLPSLGHIDYDSMYEGYKEAASGLADGGVDLFLIETAQDPLQIKACLHAIKDLELNLPIMVSVTIELSGTMLIGTDISTIATILEPFDIFSLGINCGTGPAQMSSHLKALSSCWDRPISVHANAGLPMNIGGETIYPMSDEEFANEQFEFSSIDGVAILGGCCGTTPKHIGALKKRLEGLKPKITQKEIVPSLASLFESKSLIQDPPPFLIGERSNATGSKAFRELLLNQDFDGTLSVANEQIRSGAHGLDVSVGFAGRDEAEDMRKIISLYAQKTMLPLMIDTTQINALEAGLKSFGGRAIINSVNFEDGEKKFDEVCKLAKRFGAALVCLVIDEKGMAKSKERKIEIAQRALERAVSFHALKPQDLVFDLLTFTVGSGDEEYKDAAIETIEAIKEFKKIEPRVGFVLGISNISFGLARHAREYLNSIFLHHCIEAGLSMAIVNVKNTLPLHQIGKVEREVCENLLFNKKGEKDPLLAFIEHFDEVGEGSAKKEDLYEELSGEELVKRLLIDGEKERILKELESLKEEIAPSLIINSILIEAMKEVGELFGSGAMQLPFVLQSAEVMKASVDYLKPFLPKGESKKEITIVLGTVKGDVHDIGKNLVDIILSNNGYKVVNIGIKADINEFIKAYKEHKADAIGMSGLLVKSTAIMKENLEVLKEQNIDVPVLLGGAALNQNFVDEYCKPVYGGSVVYCKDAFDSMRVLEKIEKGELEKEESGEKKEILKEKSTKKIVQIPKPKRDFKTPKPPFWGDRVLNIDLNNLAFDWLDFKSLFYARWGYSKRGLSKDEIKKQEKDVLWPTLDRLKVDLKKHNIFNPVAIYGYYPCLSDGEDLYIFNQEEGFGDLKKSDLKKAIYKLHFPKSPKGIGLSDYFDSEFNDIVAFTCVSAGSGFSKYEEILHKEGRFQEYYLMHGLGAQLAEALAHIIHKQIRIDLQILKDEEAFLKDIKKSSFQGCRYSFGYPACPELSYNKIIFELLKPERFGITLSESFLMVPEQTTTAMVLYHPEAKYF